MSQALDQEIRADVATEAAFATTVSRLSRLSVEKHFDAYADVDWDAPDMRVDPTDPRWVPLVTDPVADTDWYQGLTPEQKATYSLYRVAAAMKVGWHFENLLQRGLLVWAFRLPNGAPEFRYVHHEIIEESQHTLMFQEVVNRSGLPVRGMPGWARFLAERIVTRTAKSAPQAFFFLVLGGEDPVDHVQRVELRQGTPHPLAERIMRIHVTEEARHISFARHYLRHTVPTMNPVRRRLLSVTVPLMMGVMTRLMLEPPADLRRHCGLPAPVARAAMRSPKGRALLADSVRKIRALCEELGLMTRAGRAAWRLVGLAGPAA
ncbi:MAG TPA: diiron oxygenase [Acidimicrobiales bacterium]